MKIDDLLSSLRAMAPEESALEGDPVGLLIEPVREAITNVVVCLDCTAHVAHVAEQTGADLIIAHHPLIYHPLKRLQPSDPIANVAMSLVRHGIGLYAMHTNWDAAAQGINDTLAAQIGLKHVRRLTGHNQAAGLARFGMLEEPLSYGEFLDQIAKNLDCKGVSTLRFAQPQVYPVVIQRVAVCGGAGAMLTSDVLAAGAEAFVTADVRHHEFIDAASRGLLLIDAGHEATEAPGMQNLASILIAQFPEVSVTFAENWAA